MFASTALFAGVILYYYDTNLSSAEISTLTEASKLLKTWKEEGALDNPLTKALINYRPKIIFHRRNTSDQDKEQYQPIPEKEENRVIYDIFDVDQLNLPSPTKNAED